MVGCMRMMTMCGLRASVHIAHVEKFVIGYTSKTFVKGFRKTGTGCMRVRTATDAQED
jgi:hypothetical protein